MLTFEIPVHQKVLICPVLRLLLHNTLRHAYSYALLRPLATASRCSTNALFYMLLQAMTDNKVSSDYPITSETRGLTSTASTGDMLPASDISVVP